MPRPVELFFFFSYIFFCIIDEWLMFDDDNVTPVTSEDVLKLSGGGEYKLVTCLSLKFL